MNKVFWGVAMGLLAGLSLMAAPAAQAQRGTVTCGSVNGRYARCEVDWRGADMVRQDSRTRCVRGRNWGFERGAIWVDQGCRGQFVESRGWGGGDRPGWGGGRPPGWGDDDRPGWGGQVSIQCGSVDGRYRLCPVRLDRRSDVRLVNNDSDTRCREGYNWGVNRDGIWVDRGCRGRFVITRR
ncbi:DUF3011 domain-containing protein [Frateuria defendens]|uniref:DUF3011 domain-containing protein n=1 Tax=Frateuria defendens TaxID=2219559 RepID=UPI00066FFE8C|nr:DUF3011 domain-containing protein [Frateuria defendens]